MESGKGKPNRKKTPLNNPIEVATTIWFQSNVYPQQPQLHLYELTTQIPRRWTVYEPMVLLPTGSFDGIIWKQIFLNLSDDQVGALWTQILAEISKRTGGVKLTHLAVNEGIPATHHSDLSDERTQGDSDISEERKPEENILRSPTGLRMLQGDFGSASIDNTAPDFEQAFWVSTRQNGVFQTWTPRWTMFSRGNIKEKARLLDFHDNRTISLDDAWAIDLYAGIGYFTFSYAKLGMRVLCWELNPWSVEGLRRGAKRNGWSVKVVKDEYDLALPMKKLVSGGEQIIVFLEDNKHAVRRIKELEDLNILHVNCGLLPSSDASWKDVWDIAASNKSEEAWLHLHENVGVADIEKRKEEIEQYFEGLMREDGGHKTAHVEHTELVKTFAPGVRHCVFDLHINKSTSIT
ncbi:S-adenosyl-L-methionine-dependent methyltransferase [Hypoxylon trugodes]|uniref:S-adenosyl-L-methionine-dependent methyltransferase n=1 Tax=Hypoxylon trugodes TaxID=326681 RepID=UPI0021993D23|nr:S-adenosyl-L-methionine-dependent methyltransferase [Hypoxylon trugodes]KAI1389209.1 S-adenosyl-L-methionine-dependent methyltransferase [Hypoxylon trugodes]